MATGDEHKVKGKIEQVKGAIKEGFGAMTGDRSREIEGKTERAKGHVRESWGEVRNDLDDDRTNDPVSNDPTRRRP